MLKNKVYSFSIPGFTSQREWSVYIVVAIPIDVKDSIRKIYVGKVGDNSKGCNPIITRIGNHLSHYADHSQLRNKIGDTTKYDYHVFFATFGEYTGKDKNNLVSCQLDIVVYNVYLCRQKNDDKIHCKINSRRAHRTNENN